MTPLTGGVASDIASLKVGDARYCVKFALPKLKVAADWRAPRHRNAAEYAWLEVAARVVPESAVRLYGRSDSAHGFVMEFVTGAETYLWKTALLEGQPAKGEARAVGDMVGRIHAASAKPNFDRSFFWNRDDFRALRIEPYLSFTAEQHRHLAPQLHDLADMLYDSTQVLVHGDVSPKNILIRHGRPIILDAECATMGDASFDPSFCLNHLILKAVHLPAQRTALYDEVAQFWRAYAPHVSWEDASDLEARICRLLPALMLARVDGKSPVEYLGTPRREQVRKLALPLIGNPPATLSDFVQTLTSRLKELDAWQR
ncbi:phosphotransferase [Ruegeria jejuensis]|uniref:phosphotransferase n=1 Tax=Ruegeria jejuensis TaxID=3233338 RepID=UPI00355C311D